MIIETIVWIIVSILTAIISSIVQKYFTKNKALQEQMSVLEDIKSKKYKSLNEQMSYVRGRSDMGMDFVTMVTSTLIFLLGFYIGIYPWIPNIYVGLIVIFVLALAFSWISAKVTKSTKFFDYHIINSFISYLYSGLFLVYVRFIDNMHPLLLLLCGIASMVGFAYLSKKWGVKHERS